MKLLSLIFILLLPPLGIIAQGPPSIFGSVGIPLRQQITSETSPTPVDGTQVFGLFAETGHTLPSLLGLGTVMRLGGELWMFTAACEYDPGGTTIQMVNSISNNVSYQFFSLSVMTNTSWIMPFGAIGHNTVFSTPEALVSPLHTFEVAGDPIWTMTHNMGNIAYPDPWKASFIKVHIPSNAALTGMLYSAQSYRLTGPWQMIIYCSDEIVFQTG
tara:strand:- start:458 stop:1102 length:645 start_codon:yes stop_codon:yes gene_type:complete